MASADEVTSGSQPFPNEPRDEPHQGTHASGIRATVHPSDTRWRYVATLFAYTNQLMERTQVRCNYLILANSVAMVAFLTVVNAFVSNRGEADHPLLSTSHVLVAALAPSAFFLASLMLSVIAFLPRIYEYDIELNQEFIASMPVEQYRELVYGKSEDGTVDDFIEEIHVLSRILNDRTRRVDMAARTFVFAVVLMLIVAGLTAA